MLNWRIQRDNKTKGYKAGVPVKRFKTIQFNPASRDHIADRLITLKGWKPKKFTQACVSDIDRDMKVKSERASMLATKQIDNHTNGGYSESKQLY